MFVVGYTEGGAPYGHVEWTGIGGEDSVDGGGGSIAIEESLDVYSHLWPEDEERTRSAVDRVLGDLVSPPCHPEEAVD
jgi:hypothetical protein